MMVRSPSLRRRIGSCPILLALAYGVLACNGDNPGGSRASEPSSSEGGGPPSIAPGAGGGTKTSGGDGPVAIQEQHGGSTNAGASSTIGDNSGGEASGGGAGAGGDPGGNASERGGAYARGGATAVGGMGERIAGGGGTGGIPDVTAGGSGGQSSANGGMGGGAGAAAGNVLVSSNELIFSSPRNTASRVEHVSVVNQSTMAITLAPVTLSGAGSARFSLVAPASEDTVIAAGASLDVEVVFNPTEPGLRTATLTLSAPALESGSYEVSLFGLGAKGLEGSNEPAIQEVLATLGFDIDLGSEEFHLPTSAGLIGSEVAAPQFRRAMPGVVNITPVARYSPNERLPYGYYSADGTLHEVGAIAEDQHQSLNPSVAPGSEPGFDPRDELFGIFTNSKVHTVYTEDSRNTGRVSHAVRTYPLRNRAGVAVPSSYLVCFEEASNGDYQDYIFVLENVTPVE